MTADPRKGFMASWVSLRYWLLRIGLAVALLLIFHFLNANHLR